MEDSRESENLKEVSVRQWPTRLLASCLLIVMLCTVAATPVAVIVRLNQQRENRIEDRAEKPSSEFDVGRIAYISTDRQLYTSAPDGRDRYKLTESESAYQFPAWSPDSSQVAIVSEDTLYSFLDREGAERDGEFRILYQDEADRPFYLYWSPDGREISFLTNHESGLALWLAAVESSAESRAVAFGQPFYWDWDPGGEQMLIHTGLSGADARLALLDSEMGDIGGNIADPGLFQAPGISFDGRFWAYAQTGSDRSSHLTIDNVSDDQVVQDEEQGHMAMSWSPTQNVLAYISSGDRNPAFYGPLKIVNAETGDRQIVVRDTIIAFFWSPDGRSIAYLKLAEQDDDSVLVDSTLDKRNHLSKPLLQRESLRMELWVFDLSRGDSRWLASFEPSAMFTSQFLPYFDQYALSHRLWSPNSDALILPVRDGDRSRLYIVPVDGGGLFPLASGEIGFWSAN